MSKLDGILDKDNWTDDDTEFYMGCMKPMCIEIQHPEHTWLKEQGFEQYTPYFTEKKLWCGYDKKGQLNLRVLYELDVGVRGTLQVLYDIKTHYTELRIWSGLGGDDYHYLIDSINSDKLRELLLLLIT